MLAEPLDGKQKEKLRIEKLVSLLITEPKTRRGWFAIGYIMVLQALVVGGLLTSFIHATSEMHLVLANTLAQVFTTLVATFLAVYGILLSWLLEERIGKIKFALPLAVTQCRNLLKPIAISMGLVVFFSVVIIFLVEPMSSNPIIATSFLFLVLETATVSIWLFMIFLTRIVRLTEMVVRGGG
ncbi:MAG: hypothetical protein ABSB28_05330 [Candidatus Bathyarchaeia archaeon]